MKTNLRFMAFVLLGMMLSVNQVWGVNDTTYTFTSKSWATSPASWTSTKDATQYSTDEARGVSIQKNESGAGAEMKFSSSNITKIIFNCSKSNKGVGSISLKVGSTEVWSTTSFNTSATSYTIDASTYKDLSSLSGKISFVVTCTTSTLYVKSIQVFTAASTKTAV